MERVTVDGRVSVSDCRLELERCAKKKESRGKKAGRSEGKRKLVSHRYWLISWGTHSGDVISLNRNSKGRGKEDNGTVWHGISLAF